MLYLVGSAAYARYMCKQPTKSTVTDQLLLNFGALPKPRLPLPGTAATLCVDDKRFDGRLAIVLAVGVNDRPGSVDVFLYELRRRVCVPRHALVDYNWPPETHKEWWTCRIAPGFPMLSEIATIYSNRVLRVLFGMGLGRPELVVVTPLPGSRPAYCHENARRVAEYPARPVFGYSLMPSLRCQCVEFEAHSVVRDGNGRLFDVTPDWAGEKAKFFVEETMFDFLAMTDAAHEGLFPQGTVYPFRPDADGFCNILCTQPCCNNKKPLEERLVVANWTSKQAFLDNMQREEREGGRLFRDDLIKTFPA